MTPPFDLPAAKEFLGVRVHPLGMDGAVALLDRALASRSPLQVGVLNAAKVVNMGRDPALREAVLSSDLLLADGMSVVWASRVLGEPLPERVTGIDLMFRLLGLCDRKGYRVYCLGAEEGVIREVARRIAAEYPGAVLAGWRNGYYAPGEEEAIVGEIARCRPDLLLVAMTSPKKEAFMARWGEKMGVTVCHGVGGSFDVWAGKVSRAPEAWQKAGFEWLYRVIQEPRRMWKRYLVTNSLFLWMVASERLRALFRRGTSGRGTA